MRCPYTLQLAGLFALLLVSGLRAGETPAPRRPAGANEAMEHVRLAVAAHRAGQFETALEEISEAIRLDPANIQYRRQRATLCLQMKRFSQTYADCTELIKLDPKDPGAYFFRGCAHEFPSPRFVTEQAIADFTKSIELSPSAEGYRRRGDEYHLGMRDLTRALADYDAALKLDPRSYSAYLSRGMVQDSRKEYDRAAADFSKALEIAPRMPLLFCLRGEVYRKAGKLKVAESDFTRAIVLDPQYGFAYRQRGETRTALGDNLGAERDRVEAAQLPLGPNAGPSMAGRPQQRPAN